VKLLFVYNANAGLLAGIMDSVHKIVSPATYDCALCAITYGALRMDPKWKAWLKAQPFEAVFHHRPDFRAAYPRADIALPAIVLAESDKLEMLVGADDFGAIDSVDALIALIGERLALRSAR